MNYKKVPGSINKKAEDLLRTLLDPRVSDETIGKSLSKLVVCGPGLWKGVKGAAPLSLHKSKPVSFVVPTGSGMKQFDGKGVQESQAKIDFWEMILAYDLKFQHKRTIRKATAEEISYYWAIIPYDFEEPLYVVDYVKMQFIFDFSLDEGVPRVMFVEIVGGIDPSGSS